MPPEPDPAGFPAREVALRAQGRDPSIGTEIGTTLALDAWALLRERGSVDAADIARELVARLPEVDASAASHVAVAVVDVCRERGLTG